MRLTTPMAILACVCLLLAVPLAAASPRPGPTPPPGNPYMSESCYDVGVSYDQVCVTTYDGGHYHCEGVSLVRRNAAGTWYGNNFYGVCHDKNDATNVGVCSGYSTGYTTPGGTYSDTMECTGHWEGCMAWTREDNGNVDAEGNRVSAPGWPQETCTL